MEAVLSNALLKKYKQMSARCRALFFSAPCGFGKTSAAHALVKDSGALFLSARNPDFALPEMQGRWSTLVIDDVQEMEDQVRQDQFCALLRECPDRHFLLLSRGVLPGWLLPFQTAGVLAVFSAQDFQLDTEATGRLLLAHHVALSDADLTALHQETQGYPLAVELLAQHLERGEPYNRTTTDGVRRELFLYYEEQVLRPMDPSVRRMLMELSVFDTITPELARIVTGDPRVRERLEGILRVTTMLRQRALEQYQFWGLFRRFLQWELSRHYTEEQRRSLYDRGALYYELNEEYGPALDLYTKSGNHEKVLDLLTKNA